MLALTQGLMSLGAGGGGGSDPFFSNVVSLLNLEGPNGSTVYTDATGRSWAQVGNAVISTASFPFGTSSLALDGVGDAISTASSVDFDFGAGDFTVECLVRVNTLGNQVFFSRRNSEGFSPFGLGVFGNKLQMLVSTTGTSWASIVADPVDFVTSAWTHVALTRLGSTFTIWKSGAAVASATVSGSVMSSSDGVRVGHWFPGNFETNGFIKGFRATRGVCRYTATFTPPSSLWPTS